jgi:uncharacterized repeat protein (TIGR03803 family)
VTFASVIRVDEGNFYGATTNGGDLNGCGGVGCGVVFKLDPKGRETVLHTFSGGTDAIPVAGLLLDDEGNLYGTASGGGDRHATAEWSSRSPCITVRKETRVLQPRLKGPHSMGTSERYKAYASGGSENRL